MKLTIRAVDFGLTEGSTEASIELVNLGIVNSISISATGMYINRALQYLHNTNIRTGIHLMLTDTYPLMPVESIFSIVDYNTQKFFTNKKLLEKKIKKKIVNIDDIEKEFYKQIEFLIMNDINIEYIDTHRNIILIPVVYGIIKKLARVFKIEKIVLPPIKPSLFVGRFLRSLLSLQKGYSTYLHKLEMNALTRAVQKKQDITIITHPCYSNKMQVNNLYAGESELELLKSPEFKNFLYKTIIKYQDQS